MNRDRLWGLAWIAAVAAVVLLGTLLGLVPKVEEARAAARDITAVEDQNTMHEFALAALKVDYKRIDELKKDLVDLQVEVPLTASIPSFLAQLDATAAQHQVTLNQITVSDGTGYAAPIAVAAPVADATPVPAAAPVAEATPVPAVAGVESIAAANPRLSAENYISVPISIEASGTSSTVLDFLSGLQYGDRIIAINSFSTSSGATVGVVTVTIEAEIYVLLAPTGTTAP